MTQQMPTKHSAIKWSRVASVSAGLVACVGLVALLWPQPEKLPTPPKVVEPPPPFVSSQAFEVANDLPVLRAVLEPSCKSKRPEILDSKPDEKPWNRSSKKTGKFPEGLGCKNVLIVDSQELEALFKKPYQGKQDFKHFGGWGNFFDTYPNAVGLLTLSLPSYPSPTSAVVNLGRTCGYTCGAGWEIILVKLNGKWVIREQRPSWIA